MKKRILSILLTLCMVLLLAPTTAFAEDSVYVVAGSSELCGNLWKGYPEDSPGNIMTHNDDGTYQKVYSNVGVMDKYQFKVVENTNDEQIWRGLDDGGNVIFSVKSVCDVTITFDPETLKITVTGAGVEIPTTLNVESVHAIGNGDPEDPNWLNGIAWDPSANLMTEVSTGVYEITYRGVEKYNNYQVKFAANGTWTDSWGGVYQGSGIESEAVYNGDNLEFDVTEDNSDVTLRLDLTNFDYATKNGAKFTVTIGDETPTSSETTDISSVAITDIETPAANTTLDTSASCTTTGVSSTTPQITWTPSDSAAGYNTSYTASITLTADTGYKFADAVTATVSGNNATSVTKNADGTLTVTYAFPEIPDTIDPVISGIENNKTYCDDVEFTNKNAWGQTVLRIQATASKASIKLKWNEVPEADGYVIYWSKCGFKSSFKQVKVIGSGKNLTWTHKSLKKGSWNRYYVKAYKVIDGKKSYIKASNKIHLTTKGGKYTNVKKLKASISSLTLKKGKTKALKIKQTYAEKNKKPTLHMRPLIYTTSDKTVATVTSKGVIKAKGTGSCYIYVTAYSGVYTKVKVTVK